MSSMFEGVMVHMEFAKILSATSLVSVIITVIVYLIFRNSEEYSLAKYIPGLILLIVGVFTFIRLDLNLDLLIQRNRILIATIELVGGAVSILTGLIVGVITK